MMPLATATGKITYASCVNGSWRMKKRVGGMTSLSLRRNTQFKDQRSELLGK